MVLQCWVSANAKIVPFSNFPVPASYGCLTASTKISTNSDSLCFNLPNCLWLFHFALCICRPSLSHTQPCYVFRLAKESKLTEWQEQEQLFFSKLKLTISKFIQWQLCASVMRSQTLPLQQACLKMSAKVDVTRYKVVCQHKFLQGLRGLCLLQILPATPGHCRRIFSFRQFFQGTRRHRTFQYHSAGGDNHCHPGQKHSTFRHWKLQPSKTEARAMGTSLVKKSIKI